MGRPKNSPNAVVKKDNEVNSSKLAALESAMSTVNKRFGANTLMRLGDNRSLDVSCVSSGSLTLDNALGKGLPYGRIVEIYGPEASGKTTLTLSVIRQAQKDGKTCAFIDAEHALDPIYAKKLGVDLDSLLISQPDTGEQALEIADALARSGAVDVIVVDSVAALVPKAELEGDIGDSHMGLAARMMSQALRKLTPSVKSSNTLLIFINQIRMKIGVMFGNPETTTGGNALKFYASVRLDIRRTGAVKVGDEVVGSETKIKVVKNKIAAPFKEAQTRIMYGEGFDFYYELTEFCIKYGFIQKAGSWFTFDYDGVKERIQGNDNMKNLLKSLESDNPKLFNKLVEEVREKMFGSIEPIPDTCDDVDGDYDSEYESVLENE